MARFEFADSLELLGVLGGGFVLLAALGTLAGLPWTTTEATGAAVVQTLGTLATIALGLGLIAIAYDGNVGDLRPGSNGE